MKLYYLTAVAATAALMFSTTQVQAENRIQGAWVGCVSEKSLDHFITSATNKDNRLMQSLLGTECVPIQGLEYSMLDQGFVTSEIRVYVPNSGSLDLFVPAEAAR